MRRQLTKTLLYSEIFNYPLSASQIWKYFLTSKKVSRDEISRLLKKEKIKQKKGFYFLGSNEEIISLRIQREKESVKKIRYARKKISILSYIPGVKLLAISGSLSMNNADKNDDIDLFIITSRNQMWTTRLVMILVLKFLGVYRNRSEAHTANKFCLNMIIEESNLAFPARKRNIYTAHEIVQILPIFTRNNMYAKFINSNSWIKKYMANFEQDNLEDLSRNLIMEFFWKILELSHFEELAKRAQLTYMKEKKGRETIANGFLAFHPKDPSERIIKTYNSKLKKYFSTTLGH